MFPIVLAQLDNGFLPASWPPFARLAAALGVALVAFYAAWTGARQPRGVVRAGTWAFGALVALGGGFGVGGLAGALAGLLVYAFAGALIGVYHLQRDGDVPIWLLIAGLGAAGGFALYGPQVGLFAVAAGMTLYGAFATLKARELVHATVYLALMLLGVAFTFLSLGAQFLFLIQILVYIGAVITLFLFTVMLTIPAKEAHFLDELELPPGITIESVEDLGAVVPQRGQGPMKDLEHPRRPTRVPDTMYGIALSDDVYATEDTPAKGTKEGA